MADACSRCAELEEFIDTHFSNGEAFGQGYAAGLRAASPDPQLLERIAELQREKATMAESLNYAVVRANLAEEWMARYRKQQHGRPATGSSGTSRAG